VKQAYPRGGFLSNTLSCTLIMPHHEDLGSEVAARPDPVRHGCTRRIVTTRDKHSIRYNGARTKSAFPQGRSSAQISQA
jgi:hypothetical protein